MLEGKENYRYFGILGVATIKQAGMKGKMREEYLRQTRKFVKTKLCIKGINTRVVSLVRYLGPFLKRTKEELRQIDQRTSKFMTMHKALHLSSRQL